MTIEIIFMQTVIYYFYKSANHAFPMFSFKKRKILRKHQFLVLCSICELLSTSQHEPEQFSQEIWKMKETGLYHHMLQEDDGWSLESICLQLTLFSAIYIFNYFIFCLMLRSKYMRIKVSVYVTRISCSRNVDVKTQHV